MVNRLRGLPWRRRPNPPPLPPQELISFVGSKDADAFVDVGREFLAYFKDLSRLQPDDDVLELGSGSGRIAVPLAEYLDARASYHGIEVSPEAVAWCSEHLTSRYKNFQFHHADVFNNLYNPTGTQKSDAYRFPVADASFDFVILTSVFTHMLPDDVANYLREIRRVLRPGGRVFATFFLLDDYARQAIEDGKSYLPFVAEPGVWWSMEGALPEEAVLYDEAFVRQLYADAGLPILEPPRYGNWCERPGALTFQDVILTEMPRA